MRRRCRSATAGPLATTVFANTIAAYEALPESMKRRLAGRKAIHRYAARRRVADSPRPKLTQAQLEETPDIAHPIVRTHPYTGRKALYVTAGECVGIEGMAEGRSGRADRRARRPLRTPRVFFTGTNGRSAIS